MKKIAKRGLILIIISVLFLTTVYAGSVIFTDNTNADSENKVKELLEEYSSVYGDDITLGGELYVWAGDINFNPKEYLPDGNLREGETVEYVNGNIDLTPGTISPVIYKFNAKEEIRYELFVFTSVSRKYSSNVGSDKKDNIIYGISKSENFGGYVPGDYTESNRTYENSRELTIVKGSKFYPEFSNMNYNPDDYVVSISEGNLNTDKTGTYSLKYSISPISDAQMNWFETYKINVVDKEQENKGIRVVAGDNTIHATVRDENGNDSEVFMGNEYNLNAGIERITVQNLRGYDAYADIEVLKDGKPVNKDNIIKSAGKVDNDYVIEFKSYNYKGYEIRLSNNKVLSELLNKPSNTVNGGWDDHTKDDEIIVDELKEDSPKTFSSTIKGIFDSFTTNAEAAESSVTSKSVKSAISSLAISHTCQEYHNGQPTGVTVFDGVKVNLSKNKLISLIKDMLDNYGLQLTSESGISTQMYLNCVDHGKAGYYTSQLSQGYITYVTAYLMKDGNKYRVVVQGQYYGSGRQRLNGSFSIGVETVTTSISIHKDTKAGNSKVGEVQGAEFNVYTKKKDANKNKNRLITLVTDKNGNATTNSKQSAKLKQNETYYIKEVKAPKGANLSDKVYTVTTPNNSSKAVKLNVVNTCMWIQPVIYKYDADDKKIPIKDAKFTVSEWNGKKYVKKTTLTTGSDGYATSAKLYYTKTNQGKWRIKETDVPKPYKVDTKAVRDYQISSKNANQVLNGKEVWEVPNKSISRKAAIGVEKMVVDGADKNVSNKISKYATFTIYNAEKGGKAITSFSTGKDGKGVSKKCLTAASEGTTYWVEETWWGKGMEPYERGKRTEVKVKPNEIKYIKASVSNRSAGLQKIWECGLRALKIDTTTGDPLAGATFTFYEWNGSKYVPITDGTKVSGADGYATIGINEHKVLYTDINQGRFAVAETIAPDGYSIDNPEMHFVTITSADNGKMVDFDKFEFRDTPFGWFDLTKIIVDAEGNLETGYDFADIVLDIHYGVYLDRECTKPLNGYQDIVLGEDGHFTSGRVAPKTYYLKETRLNSTIFSNRAGATVEFEVKANQTTYLDGRYGIRYGTNGNWWGEPFGIKNN